MDPGISKWHSQVTIIRFRTFSVTKITILSSMDYISFDSFENTASNLPIHIVGHCIVTVNHNYVLLIR